MFSRRVQENCFESLEGVKNCCLNLGIDSNFEGHPIHQEPPISKVAQVLHEPSFLRVLEEKQATLQYFSVHLECMEKVG